MSKTFPLHQALMVTTGILLGEMKEVYEILGFMTGGPVWTHQIGRAIESAAPAILQRYPELADIDASDCHRENWREWLDKQREKYPAEYELVPLSNYKYKDPVDELADMVGEDKVIPVII